LTNFLAVVIAATNLDAEAFGWFSVCYASYLIILGATQAYFSQVIVLEAESVERAARQAISRCAVVGAVLGIALAGVAFGAVEPAFRSLFLVLALALPALLCQDVFRTVAASLHRPAVAAVSDAVWLLTFLVLAGLCWLTDTLGAVQVFGAWAAGGVAGLLAAAAPLRDIAKAADRSESKGTNLGRRFLGEYVVTQGANQASVVALSGLAGVAATGAVRGTTTLFGPIGMIISVIPVLLVPPLRRLDVRRRHRAYAGMCVFLSAVPLALVALLLTADGLGPVLLGDTWRQARPLVVPVGLQFAAIGVSTVGFTALRLTEPRRTLPLKIAGSAIFLGAFWFGYWLGGVTVAMWGLFMGSTVQGALGWLTYARATTRRSATRQALHVG
jgi:hypothetical protein